MSDKAKIINRMMEWLEARIVRDLDRGGHDAALTSKIDALVNLYALQQRSVAMARAADRSKVDE